MIYLEQPRELFGVNAGCFAATAGTYGEWWLWSSVIPGTKITTSITKATGGVRMLISWPFAERFYEEFCSYRPLGNAHAFSVISMQRFFNFGWNWKSNYFSIWRQCLQFNGEGGVVLSLTAVAGLEEHFENRKDLLSQSLLHFINLLPLTCMDYRIKLVGIPVRLTQNIYKLAAWSSWAFLTYGNSQDSTLKHVWLHLLYL